MARFVSGDPRPRKFERVKRREANGVPISNHPSVNAVANMSRSERTAILEDPQHPDHAQVKEYSRLQGERFTRAAVKSGVLDTMNAKIASSVADVLGGMNLGVSVTGLLPDEPILASPSAQLLDAPEIELTPLRAPMSRVAENLEESNKQLLSLTRALSGLLENAEVDAEVQRRRARWSLAAAWAAVGFSVLVGVAQIIAMVVLDQ